MTPSLTPPFYFAFRLIMRKPPTAYAKPGGRTPGYSSRSGVGMSFGGVFPLSSDSEDKGSDFSITSNT